MKFLLTIILLLNFKNSLLAAEPLKNEIEGCPDNSECNIQTGLLRSKWLLQLKNLVENKKVTISTYPITSWSKVDSSKTISGLITWNSPCPQHNLPESKVHVGEIFVPDLSAKTQLERPQIIFNKITLLIDKQIKTITVPRGDAPLMMSNTAFYYTKDEEGLYYGLLVAFSGALKVVKTKHIIKFPKEVECPKSISEEFYRSAPSLNFFKGHFCKEIWNQDTSSYSTIGIGWSCN